MSDQQPDQIAEYVPTLGEYAELIEWLTNNPGKYLPVRFMRVHDDAIKRAWLRRYAATMAAQFDGPGSAE